MGDQRIDSFPYPVRAATGIPKTGTATDRRPRRQEGEEKRNPKGQSRLKRQLFNLLFEEIDKVEELGPVQRERLKRNIRAHLALQALQQQQDHIAAIQASQQPPGPGPAAAHSPDAETDDQMVAATDEEGGELPLPAQTDLGDGQDHHETLIGIGAPLHPHLPMDELEQNTILAAQLRQCLTRRDVVARQIAVYLHLLLSIDGALAPHFVVEA